MNELSPMNYKERFLRYVTFDTRSDEASDSVPSTHGQRIFAQSLVKELEALGLADVFLDDHCYLMATLPANVPEPVPVIGFIAHLDTSPDLSGANVRPRVLAYDGGDVTLNSKEPVVLSPAMFPELLDYTGQEIVVTDGRTLLGADDKAGIAAIVSAINYLKQHPAIKHGKIRIAFTPDEEIGRGADRFDVQAFGCDFAYTVDGGALGELEYENFNAASADIIFKGLNVHPGTAKDKMINASLLALEFAARLPAAERPEHTQNREGFYHLTALSGTVEDASLSYIIRDHFAERFEQRKTLLTTLAADMNRQHPGTVRLELRDQYRNMREVIESNKAIVDLAHQAMTAVGVKPVIKPIRGGTDGARLSFMGLPCPNIFTGGLNFHGRYEFLPLPSLEKSMLTIVKIAELLPAFNFNR
ncbi:Peptidase T [Bacteroidales bacterium Barb6XT]|nr:Peptidase T [Bacteroidales bacterium Barb6XT]